MNISKARYYSDYSETARRAQQIITQASRLREGQTIVALNRLNLVNEKGLDTVDKLPPPRT